MQLPQTPSFRLDGRTALVAGASSGIDLGCAVALAEAGAHVVACAHNAEHLTAQGASRREPAVLLHLVSPHRAGVTRPEVSAAPGRFLASLPGVVGTDQALADSERH